MTDSPLIHLRLVAINDRAFCGVKVDRYTRCEIEHAERVTCHACLNKALEFHTKEIAGVRAAMAKHATRETLAEMITDERVRELRDSLPEGKDRELLTAGLVPGDCPICGSEGDELCRSGRRGAPEMDRQHWQRVHLGKARKAARARAVEILVARQG